MPGPFFAVRSETSYSLGMMEMEPMKCPICGETLSLNVGEGGPTGVLNRVERHIVTDAMMATRGDRAAAAEGLQISVDALGRLIRKHDINLSF